MRKNAVIALALGFVLSVGGLTVAQNTSGNQSGTGTQTGSSAGGQSSTAGSNQQGSQRDRQTGTSDNRTSDGGRTGTGGDQTTTDKQTGGTSGDSSNQNSASGSQTGNTGSSASGGQNTTGAGGSTSGQSGNRSDQSGSSSQSTSRGAGASGGMLNAQDREFVMMAAMGGMAEIEMARLALQRASSDAVKQYAQKMIDDHTRANEELMRIASAKGISLPGDMSMTGGMSTHSTSATGGTDNQSSSQDRSASGGTSNQTSDQNISASGSAGSQSASAQGSTASATSGAAGSRSGSTTGSTASTTTPKMRGNHKKHTAVMSRLQNLSGAEFDREYMMQAGDRDHQQQLKLFQRQASRGGDAELRAFAAKTVPIVQGHLDSARNLIKMNRGGNSGSTTSNRSNQ